MEHKTRPGPIGRRRAPRHLRRPPCGLPRNIAEAKGMSRSKAQALGKIEKLIGRGRLVELKTTTFIEFCKIREVEGAGPATIFRICPISARSCAMGARCVAPSTRGDRADCSGRRPPHAAARRTGVQGRRTRPPPTDDELKRLIAHWSPNPRQSIPMIDLTLFAVATAMRLGEIVGLQWEDLDENRRTIVIRARKHPTKKATNHQKVPLPHGTCTVGWPSRSTRCKSFFASRRRGIVRAGYFPTRRKACPRAFQRATEELEFRGPALP